MLYQLRDVTKRYTRAADGRRARRRRPDIGDGERLVIQGPTGGGKSTLLQMLGALDRPTAARSNSTASTWPGCSEGQLTKVRSQNIGFVFQSFNLIPTLTAQENVETALGALEVGGEERRGAPRRPRRVGLAERARHIPAELSGGQQQRVAIAGPWSSEPKVLLADEPTGNLDECMRDEIMDSSTACGASGGQTVVLVTHDTWVACRASRRIWLDEGRVTDAGDGHGEGGSEPGETLATEELPADRLPSPA